jgi:hypothetical protein
MVSPFLDLAGKLGQAVLRITDRNGLHEGKCSYVQRQANVAANKKARRRRQAFDRCF